LDKEEQASLLHDVAEFCKELRPVEVCHVEHEEAEKLRGLFKHESAL
jgi:hypothetical protein